MAAAAVALAAIALLAIHASPALAAGGNDFGDAPDGAKAGYLTAPKVVGHFPSKLASGGPRHAGVGSLRLGPTTTGEADSRQVNKDTDDGVSLAAPKACKKATLTTAIGGSAAVAAGKVVYVNAWFDWNRDGDWADSEGCAPEWGVRNLPVAASTVGKAIMVPITITAGKQVKEFWYRVTVTLDEVQIDPSGHGRSVPYLQGETEDYLFQGEPRLGPPIFEEEEGREPPPEEEKAKEKPFTVRCVPAVKVIPHGGSTRFSFAVKDKGKGLIFGAFPGGVKGKGFEITVIPSPQQGGVPKGFVRANSFRFKSKDVDPPTRIQKVPIKVTFTRGKVVRQVVCTVIIVHNGKNEQKKEGGSKGKDEGKGEHVTPPKIPPEKCGGGCGGAPPVTTPSPKGTTLTDYDLNPDGTARLHIRPTDPLEGFTIPLYPPNPTPIDPPKVTAGGMPIECELRPLELTGGFAVDRCRMNPPLPPMVDSFFDVFYGVSLDGVHPITGTLDSAAGTPLESFSAPRVPAPPPPKVNGTGNLTPATGPNSVNFNVTLEAENTTLTRFLVQLPTGQKLATGSAAGFTCKVVNFKAGVERALECTGPITSGGSIAGSLELLPGPRPGQLSAQTKLFGFDPKAEYGPFNLSQTPASPTGSGTMAPAASSTRNFILNLNSFGALDQFTLDFPNGVVVTGGSASNLAGVFTCVKETTTEVDNGLKCSGKAITNGQQITGLVQFSAVQASMGSETQLVASNALLPSGQIGPFSVTDAP